MSYLPIASQTLSAAASSITFSSIPTVVSGKTLKDLVIVVQATGSTTLEARMRLNGDTGSNYNYQRMTGNGSAASGQRSSDSFAHLSAFAKATTTQALQLKIEIMDFSATNKHKTILNRADQSATGTEFFANVWANSAVINSVQILTSTGSWASGSSFALYGIEG